MALEMDLDLAGAKHTLTRTLGRPMLLIALGGLLMLIAAWLLFGGSSRARDSQLAMEQAQRLETNLSDRVQRLRSLLQVDRVQELAEATLETPGQLAALKTLLTGRIPEVRDVRVLGPDILMADPTSLGDNGLQLLDMAVNTDAKGLGTVQLVKEGASRQVAASAVIGKPDQPAGYLLVLVDPEYLLAQFNSTLPEADYIELQQTAGRFAPQSLKKYGERVPKGFAAARLDVPGSYLRIIVPKSSQVQMLSNFQRLMMFLLGTLLLAFGVIRRQMALRSPVKFRPDPESLRSALDAEDEEEQPDGEDEASRAHEPDGPAPAPAAAEEQVSAAPTESEAVEPESDPTSPPREVSLPDIHYQLEQRRMHMGSNEPPVKLSPDIFRAYDIRGIVGKTLDAGVAYQVGQAVGSLALEQSATPVVVGRDGRHSGPDLVDGLIDGMNAAGCDVIDVGAVPTGALYFAAYELGAGSGVMVTGSHNPPDYNGFKVLIGGQTLSGEMITGLYQRIASGKLSSGKGTVRGEDVLSRYRERISGDIQLKRPIKVVADCGNGIGGICAAGVLRSIGAEVLPLFDDVDGNFPNHHPDPSEPHNLEDLIGAVKLMEAELGVAFDGDADRLGVVTPDGRIVYPDRVMMLFAREVLSRNPGATIIYDVKCTGHLDTVIREAGGKPEMWKTGHSLIKTRMKEVGAPFAGEMSGHFFFQDRWYGFDCGIYAAARLLEILADDERTPQQVLDSLPDSIATPELKVQMAEGENHRFIERLQAAASFEGARLTTIDGVRADYPDGWGLCRASNTTPVLVLRFDADSQEALDRVKEAFRAQLLALNPDLELPF